MKTKLYISGNMIFMFVLFLLLASCTAEPEIYTITFDGNGATGTPPASIMIKEDDKYGRYPLPNQGDLKYKDKTFYGWNIKADGSGKLFPSGYAYILDHIKGNTILYAQWIELGALTNLRYSYNDGFVLDFDSVNDFPKPNDYSVSENQYDGRIYIGYVLFRNYTVFPGGSTNYNSNGFKPHMLSFTPSFRDTVWDVIYGGTFEYFVALCQLTWREDKYDYDIIVGPHSNVVSFEVRSDGTPLPAPKSLRAILYETNTYGETTVQISWKEVPRAYGYRLYYSYDNNNYYNIEGNTVTVLHRTNYTDYIPEGSTVYYKITAVNRMMENGYFSEPVIPKLRNLSGDTYEIVLKNNYASAISRAYTRDSYTSSWGNNLAVNHIVTNNSILLGSFEPDLYEVLAESISYYRINTGTNDRGLNITGGILDGYQPIYYLQPEFDLKQSVTLTVPATGWIKIKPE
jgi:hypothetical protein